VPRKLSGAMEQLIEEKVRERLTRKLTEHQVEFDRRNNDLIERNKLVELDRAKVSERAKETEKREAALVARERFAKLGEAITTVMKETATLSQTPSRCVEHDKENCEDYECHREMRYLRRGPRGFMMTPFGPMPV